MGPMGHAVAQQAHPSRNDREQSIWSTSSTLSGDIQPIGLMRRTVDFLTFTRQFRNAMERAI
jgi:hypothetical protein